MSSALYFILFCLSYSFPLTSLARITHHNNTDTDSDFPLSLLKTAAMRRKSTKSDVPVAETKEEIKLVDDTSADNKQGDEMKKVPERIMRTKIVRSIKKVIKKVLISGRNFPHPDNSKNDKFRLQVRAIEEIIEKYTKTVENVYIWQDYSCLDQNLSFSKMKDVFSKQLEQVIGVCDCILTPVVDESPKLWNAPIDGWADIMSEYAAPRFCHGPEAYTANPWSRVEMLFAAYLKYSPVNLQLRLMQSQSINGTGKSVFDHNRPHFLYGDKEYITKKPPLVLPFLTRAHIKTLSPTSVFEHMKVSEAVNISEKELKNVQTIIIDLVEDLKDICAIPTDAGYIGGVNEFGQWHGRGVYTWSTGDVYEGDFNNDSRSGNGTMHWSNGDIYEGNFTDGVQQGKGKYIETNGNVYVGEFTNDRKNGDGKYTWATGMVYTGEFINDKPR